MRKVSGGSRGIGGAGSKGTARGTGGIGRSSGGFRGSNKYHGYGKKHYSSKRLSYSEDYRSYGLSKDWVAFIFFLVIVLAVLIFVL